MVNDMNNTYIAFILTTIAGFSTMIGTLIIFLRLKNYNRIIVASLSFAASIMICISISDLIPESIEILSNYFNSFITCLFCILFIMIGIIISMLIDYKIPNHEKLYKVGIISMIAIIIHNIPEGIATFIATTNDINLGISLTLAITLHNIPEGIAISIPIYYSTNSKKKALIYTLISALSEPFGALITYIFLKDFITLKILGFLFSIIAGIMIQISICELIPHTKNYKLDKLAKLYFTLGTIFSIIYFMIF